MDWFWGKCSTEDEVARRAIRLLVSRIDQLEYAQMSPKERKRHLPPPERPSLESFPLNERKDEYRARRLIEPWIGLLVPLKRTKVRILD